jgi:hypothetical protein
LIGAATIRRRLVAGDTYSLIGADLGLSADAMRKRAARLGVTSTSVLGRHRRRPFTKPEELARRREEKRKAA